MDISCRGFSGSKKYLLNGNVFYFIVDFIYSQHCQHVTGQFQVKIHRLFLNMGTERSVTFIFYSSIGIGNVCVSSPLVFGALFERRPYLLQGWHVYTFYQIAIRLLLKFAVLGISLPQAGES